MTQSTQVMELATRSPARAPQGIRTILQRWSIGALALVGLACAGSAWADSLALMSGAGQSGLGGSQAQQPLVVQVLDANGVAVAGRTINWTTSNGFVLGAPSSVTDSNGDASVSFTYGNYGTTAIVATDPVAGNSEQAPETSIGSDSITVISGNNQSGKAGSASAQPIVVQILNASGTPVSGRTVNWTDQTAFTHVNAATSTTDSNGNASMGFTYVSAGSVGSSAATIQAANSAAPSEVADAAMTVISFQNLVFSSGASQSLFVGATSAPIVAQATDASGNPLSGVTVTWSQASGAPGTVSLSNTSTVTSGGQTSITLQCLQAGAGSITAQAATNGPMPTMNFACVSAASLTLVSPDNMSGAPGSTSRVPIVVQATNADGTPATGLTINWTVLSGDGTPANPTSVTGTNGQASVGFNYGTQPTSFQASATGIATPVVEHTDVTPTNTLTIVSGQNQIGATGTPGAQPIVVQLLSAAGAPVVGANLTWSIVSGNSVSLVKTSSTTDGNGRASVNFNYLSTAGSTVIGVTNTVGTEQDLITETATGLNAITKLSGDGQSGLIGTAGTQKLVIQELDASGQPVVGRTINWNVTAGNATVKAPSSVTDKNGQTSMAFSYGPTPAVSSIQASDPLQSSLGPVQFDVIAVGENAINMISGNGQTGLPGTPSAQPFIVEVRNSAGNVVTGRVVNWTRLSGDSVLNTPTSVATDSFGRSSIGFTYGPSKGATSSFAATDAVTGQQILFTVSTTSDQNRASFLSGDGQTGEPNTPSTQPIVLQILSPGGQPVAGQTVSWSVVSGGATLTTVTNTTDANGQAKASFNFAPTAGASIIQVAGTGPNPMLLQATETTLPPIVNDSLTIVSGSGQVLVEGTQSAPLVVQLKTVAGVPVAGATINWTATNGNLKFASTVTDSNGDATNYVTATTISSAVMVQASSVNATAPANFNLSNGLVNIPGLTPPEIAVGGALDNACPALALLANPTPAQADLLKQCQNIGQAAGIDPTAAANALGQMVTETAEVQSAAAVTAQTAQFQNITLRLNALRSSSNTDSLAANTSSLAGLAFAGPGGVIPVSTLMDAFADDSKDGKDKQVGSDFSRWGFFATGTIGRGNADPRSMTPAYNFDINGVTAGVDYRQRDNWVSGVAVGYTRQNNDLADDAGHIRMTGWDLSAYSTWSFKNNLYIDGVVTWGNNSFDMTRRIDYTLPVPGGGTTGVEQIASSDPGGSLFSAALTFGGDFHKDAWTMSPYAQLIDSHMGFDGYQETMQPGPGEGLGLSVDSRSISTFSGVLGTKVSRATSTNWGVFIPTASLEWQHEFNSPQNAITAHFVNDPTQTPIDLLGDPLENSFVRLGVGASFLMSHGRSGFVLYEHTFGKDGTSQDNLGLGIRIEF